MKIFLEGFTEAGLFGLRVSTPCGHWVLQCCGKLESETGLFCLAEQARRNIRSLDLFCACMAEVNLSTTPRAPSPYSCGRAGRVPQHPQNCTYTLTAGLLLALSRVSPLPPAGLFQAPLTQKSKTQ